MSRFISIGDNHYININQIEALYIQNLGNAFDFPFKIQVVVINRKKEWVCGSYYTLEKAQKELERLINNIAEEVVVF